MHLFVSARCDGVKLAMLCLMNNFYSCHVVVIYTLAIDTLLLCAHVQLLFILISWCLAPNHRTNVIAVI